MTASASSSGSPDGGSGTPSAGAADPQPTAATDTSDSTAATGQPDAAPAAPPADHGAPDGRDLMAEMADAAVDLDAAAAAAEMEVDLQVAAVTAVARERDDYLDALRRLQADFENYKKRVEKQQKEHVERAAGELVGKLLPVCDTADLAIAHGGGEEVKQIWTALFDALEREGLERIDPVGETFDPTVHDAVAHEPGEERADGPVVVEVFRTGYRWKGRVLRPAMVRVKG